MSSSSRARQLRQHQWIKLGAFFGLLFFVFFVLLRVENMLLSCVLGIVTNYLLAPIVNAFERSGVERLTSIVVTFFLATILFSVAIVATSPFIAAQITSLKSELPKYIEGTVVLFEEAETYLENVSGGLANVNLSQGVQEWLFSWSTSVFEDLPKLLSKSLTILLLSPFFAFFLLKDGQKISRGLLALVPNNIFELALNLHHQISDQMAQFVRARLLEAGFVGMVVWVGLEIISFPYAPLMALFAALMNLIPYIGPFIAAIPPLIIAVINGNSGVEITMMLAVFAVAQIIDIVFIIPMVVAKIVDLHPVTVIIVLLLGSQLMGILGMLISIPVASALKLTIYSVYKHLTELRA